MDLMCFHKNENFCENFTVKKIDSWSVLQSQQNKKIKTHLRQTRWKEQEMI